MAQKVRNPKLDTLTARAKLTAQKHPHWKWIAPGCALGYRKTEKNRNGVWVARYIERGSPKGVRRETRLGPADDMLDADGVTALSFDQAQEKARQWFSQVGREALGDDGPGGPYTVQDAARDYLDWFKVHRKSERDTRYAIDAHILPALGNVELSRLTTKRLREWHNGLAEARPRLRTRKGKAQRYREANGDPEATRRRRSTANRVLTVLKAILNHAWQDGKVASDDAWRRVKPFPKADAAKVRYLTADECKRLVNACDQDFRRLVLAALYTGCRYGELGHMTVSDFNPDAGTMAVREAKAGKPRHVYLDDEGRRFFEGITAGRPGEAIMFTRNENGGRWGKSHQARPLAEACKRAKIVLAVNFHALRHTYASHRVMNGAPLQVVAHNLGHSDTRMVEKHYGHMKPSYIADAIRAAAPDLGIGDKPKPKPAPVQTDQAMPMQERKVVPLRR